MNIDNNCLERLALELSQALLTRQLKLVTAESCTGGLVAQAVTSIAGSSQWFEGGFVCYSNTAKQNMLGVSASSLQTFGAVSQQVAAEMAGGALLNSQANCSLSITGIAGPDGGCVEKPVGTVWCAWARQSYEKKLFKDVQCQRFLGDRTAVRLQAAHFALQYLLEFVVRV